MSTPHIESNIEDISKIVLMPGDPKRAEHIANKYLNNVKLVNSIRGMTAYTGYYKNKPITIFPSGMGMPSMGIYSYELDTIIRIGTAGAYIDSLSLGDIILVEKSISDSSYAKVQSDYNKNYIMSDNKINSKIEETALDLNIKINKGPIFSSDVFYEKENNYKKHVADYNVLGVEMETFSLFHTANILNKKATALLTVSNSFCFEKELTSEEREKNLDKMIELALETCLKL